MSIETPINRRIGAAKSRSGCTTCKIRKVKCGEEKPNCLRCSSTGRKCEYQNDRTSPSKSASPPSLTLTNSLSSSPDSGRRERYAFEYYFQHAAQHLAGGMKVDFWTKVIPQICRSEPAVWDGMIAISTLFQYPNQSLDFTLLRDRRKGSNSLNQIQLEALTWYSRSISSVHSQIERGTADPYVALVSCVLFICVETIQGRMEEALQLFGQGVTLISELRTHIAQGSVSVSKIVLLEQAIIPLFLRLGSVSLTISGTPPSDIFAFVGINLDCEFKSAEQARTSLAVLSAEVVLFERETVMYLKTLDPDSPMDPIMVSRKESLRARVSRWHGFYTRMCENNLKSQSPIDYDPLLLIYYTTMSIVLSSCLISLETVYDAHLADFETIVEQARLSLAASTRPDGSQPPFTFEVGVGLPLFLTSMKCRHPVVRRQALELLRKAPPMQGLFKCTPSALLAENFMMLEESYSVALKQATTTAISEESVTGDYSEDMEVAQSMYQLGISQGIEVPEEARIHYYCVFRPSEGLPPGVDEEYIAKSGWNPNQLCLHFGQNRFDEGRGSWRQVFECIPFGGM
ncbi:transcriptional regulator family: Fungal Specific TF [Penicillium herquei]|nr:transcriptional regulator family: Fungal Specific TF [Penicillium herquei]